MESTTRYRRTAPHKKTGRGESANFHRQRTGPKGDRVTKRSTKPRRRPSFKCGGVTDEWYDDKLLYDNVLAFPTDPDYSPSTEIAGYDLGSISYYPHTQYSAVQSSSPEAGSYSYANVMGCTSTLGDSPLFYDEQTQRSDPMLSSHPFFELGDRSTGCNFDCTV